MHIISYALDEDEDGENENECSQSILLNSSPKIQELLKFITEYARIHDVSKMKCLIFVQRRYTAKIVYHLLRRYAQATNLPVRPDFMVGANAPIPESIEAILENKFNRCVLDRFNRDETNLIVASSVLEEGVDLQVCNMVIALDKPVSLRAYMQTKGRARLPQSEYIIFVPGNEYEKLNGNVSEWRRTYDVLKEVIDPHCSPNYCTMLYLICMFVIVFG